MAAGSRDVGRQCVNVSRSAPTKQMNQSCKGRVNSAAAACLAGSLIHSPMGLFGLVSEWWPPSDDRAQCGKRGIDFNEDAFAEKRGEIVVA